SLHTSLSSFCSQYRAPRHLHSFPTRRSSDLFFYRGPRRAELVAATGLYVALFLTYGYDSIRENGVAKGVILASRFMIPIVPLLRSEEHTSELQSLRHLVCRLLLEKKKKSHSQ